MCNCYFTTFFYKCNNHQGYKLKSVKLCCYYRDRSSRLQYNFASLFNNKEKKTLLFYRSKDGLRVYGFY